MLWGRMTSAAGTRIKCHWCPVLLTYETATVDHEPPLASGGSPRQAVLACDACNQRRSKTTNAAVKAKRKRKRR